MARLAGIVLAHDRAVDLDARPCEVEVVERVVPELLVGLGADLELVRRLAVRGESVGAGIGDVGEVDEVNVDAGRGVNTLHGGHRLGDHGRPVEELPCDRFGGLGHQRGLLGAAREVAHLVDAHARSRVGAVLLDRSATDQRGLVEAERPRRG
nr:hypothetical protein [Demequina sediminis]